MAIPQWLSLTIAGLVILFGAYRLWIAVAGPSNAERAHVRRGMLAMSRRSNGLVAILYFIVGGLLIASSFGWKPWRAPASSTAPADSPGDAPAKPPGPGSALPVAP